MEFCDLGGNSDQIIMQIIKSSEEHGSWKISTSGVTGAPKLVLVHAPNLVLVHRMMCAALVVAAIALLMLQFKRQ